MTAQAAADFPQGARRIPGTTLRAVTPERDSTYRIIYDVSGHRLGRTARQGKAWATGEGTDGGFLKTYVTLAEAAQAMEARKAQVDTDLDATFGPGVSVDALEDVPPVTSSLLLPAPWDPMALEDLSVQAPSLTGFEEAPVAPALDYSWAEAPTPYRVPADERAERNLPDRMTVVSGVLAEVRASQEGAMTALANDAREVEVLDLIVWAQAQRRVLQDVIDAAENFAGRQFVQRTGEMPDGRRYRVRRGAERKSWAHDDWKRDVRAAVIKDAGLTGTVVDTETGEEVNVYEVVTKVQEAHGSSAPKVTVLRSLELDPDDYCRSEPGRWDVEFTDPVPATPPAPTV